MIHHTVEIDGEPYWDGGYAANPPLVPLVQASDAAHLLIVQVTPTASERLPKTPREIERRLERIQFNATLNAELEAIKLGIILRATPKLRRLRIGRISAQDEFAGLENESPADLGREFLDRLWQSGRGAVETWLEQAGPQGRREGRDRGPVAMGRGVVGACPSVQQPSEDDPVSGHFKGLQGGKFPSRGIRAVRLVGRAGEKYRRACPLGCSKRRREFKQ